MALRHRKTTVARIIAKRTNRSLRKLNATTAGISDIKDIIAELDTLLTPAVCFCIWTKSSTSIKAAAVTTGIY